MRRRGRRVCLQVLRELRLLKKEQSDEELPKRKPTLKRHSHMCDTICEHGYDGDDECSLLQ